MLPRFLLNQFSNKFLSTALIGLCLNSFSFAQNTPLETPKSVEYPGILQTFEKLIQIDSERVRNKSSDLVKNGFNSVDPKKVSNLDLEPDFLNSVILHSNPGYLKIASTNKCAFYNTLITDLFKNAEGKIQNVMVTYLNSENVRQSALITKKEFLSTVVNSECPETQKIINQFQIKILDKTLSSIRFEIPSGKEQCRGVHLEWLKNPNTPFLCQIYEYIKEASESTGQTQKSANLKSIAKLLEKKQTPAQKDYIENLCTNLDNEELFCEDFLNASFWNKIASGYEDKIYAEAICQKIYNTSNVSQVQLKQCLTRMKKEKDLCLYPAGKNQGLTPSPECDDISMAMNYSTLRSNYYDCPAGSDQLGITNVARLLLHTSKAPIKSFKGSCASISVGEVLDFNKKFDNDENWKLEACYDDLANHKEVCHKTYFGQYSDQIEGYGKVVAQILKDTRGAESSLECSMVDSLEYNPILLQYKSGCHIIYDRRKCFLSKCEHKILYNDRPITFIKLKNNLALDYFPSSIQDERFSQQYILTHDYKLTGKSLSNLTAIVNFFKKSKSGIIHGIGCAEDLLPSFFKMNSFNQCTPLPFIIDGMIKEKDKVAFITRTSADTLQAPRLISWSNIYSTVRSYQSQHPINLWTLYGFD